MPTPSSAGFPTFTAPRRSFSSVSTSARRAVGTSTRRIAVHFCPAFCVMSVTTSRRNRFHVSLPGSTSGASTAALSESASTLTRTLWRRSRSLLRSRRPVSADPVNASTSCAPRWSSRSPVEPQRSDSAPSGSTFASTSRRTHRSGDQRGRRRGLGDDRHAREPRARRLLGEPPGGEVERVDVHRDAVPRDEDVLAAEARRAAELEAFAVEHHAASRRASCPDSA